MSDTRGVRFSVLCVLLAAGAGTRMLHCKSKPLVQLAGAPMIKYSLDTLSSFACDIVVVVNEMNRNDLASVVRGSCNDKKVNLLTQGFKAGTAGALSAVLEHVNVGDYDVLAISYVDTPFVSVDTVCGMLTDMYNSGYDAVLLCFVDNGLTNFRSYGKLNLDKNDSRRVIGVDYGVQNVSDNSSRFLHSGFMLFRTSLVTRFLGSVECAVGSSESHITDLINLIARKGYHLGYKIVDMEEAIGINTLEDLSLAEAILQHKMRCALLGLGVSMLSPENVFLSYDTEIGSGTVIYPYVFFGSNVRVGRDVCIHPFCCIDNTVIESGASIGPFARLRDGNEIRGSAEIGNFVELKASSVGVGTKIKHLSYVGDAQIAESCNIGAGSVFCNFDGLRKHKTFVDANAFVGANSTIIAPLHVGRGSKVAAGSTITEDVPDNKLVIARKTAVLKDIAPACCASQQGKQQTQDSAQEKSLVDE